MKTGQLKKFTQRLLNYKEANRICIEIPWKIWHRIQREIKTLKEDEEFIGGYRKRERDNDHPEKDLINSILAHYYATGEADWADVEEVK